MRKRRIEREDTCQVSPVAVNAEDSELRPPGCAIDLEGRLGDGRSDPLALEPPVLAQVQGASVLGRVATGPRAGQRVLRLGSDPTAPLLTTGGRRHADIEGFDLHANAAVRAGENERLEHLCRHILRPPVAQDALDLTPDGKVLLRLRRPWRDGTRAICFEPSEFLDRLAVLVPPPRSHRHRYCGVLARKARLRPMVTARAGLPMEPTEADQGAIHLSISVGCTIHCTDHEFRDISTTLPL